MVIDGTNTSENLTSYLGFLWLSTAGSGERLRDSWWKDAYLMLRYQTLNLLVYKVICLHLSFKR